MQVKLINEEVITVTVTNEKRTYEYFVDGIRHEISVIAPHEMWQDEIMGLSFVKNEILKKHSKTPLW